MDSDFEVHLKRAIDSCFTNNCLEAGIKGFRANVDLQPVFNHYKYVAYTGLLVGHGEKKSNFAGFSGTNLRKKRLISREFSRPVLLKNDW